MNKDMSVSILSFNRLSELKKNVANIDNYAMNLSLEKTIIDNDSSDGTRIWLHQKNMDSDNDWKIVVMPENSGVAGGRNAGMVNTTCEFVLHLDDDCQISENAIKDMIDVMTNNPNLGIVFPRIHHQQTGALQTTESDEGCNIANFHGACFLLRRKSWERVGPFDDTCTFGGEELDYSIRLRRLGYEVYYLPRAQALHASLIRSTPEGMERRSLWIYNYTRITAKYFTLKIALVRAFRLIVRHTASSIKVYGFFESSNIVVAGIKGFREGRRTHVGMSPNVQKQYLSNKLRPDFGNTPLLSSAITDIIHRRRITQND